VVSRPTPHLDSVKAELAATKAALAASQQDLTGARGQIVDLLYILDAFQIESGADRNAALQTGIEAVRQLRRERDEAVRRAADLEQVREELKQLRLLADGYMEDIQQLESGRDVHIDSLRGQRDLALADLASARIELEQLRAYQNWIDERSHP
jgi:hypothetical protein